MSAPFVVRVGAYPNRAEETTAWERDQFARAGVEYEYLNSRDPQAHAQTLGRANAVVTGGGARWDAAALGLLEQCKHLVTCSVGFDAIDLDVAGRQGIMVQNFPEMCTDEVADHTLALILSSIRKIPQCHARLRGGLWDRELLSPMPRLRGLTFGLLGFGRIAREVADRARGFGMQIISHDPWIDPAVAEQADARLVDLDTLCRESDVLSVHVPLAPTTRHILSAAQFAQMKPSAILVNTARGPIVDEAALIEALRRGQLRGAGLDVFETEPAGPDNPLFRMDNVIVTPHSAGFSDHVIEAIPHYAVEQVLNVLHGGTPPAYAWPNRDSFTARTG